MKKTFGFISAFIVLAVLFTAIAVRSKRPVPLPPPGLSASHSSFSLMRSIILRGPEGQQIPLTIEVANTDAAREKGLMNRTDVGDGMLFIFDREQAVSFWMKNTLVPLDILFFAGDGTFRASKNMIPCTADPCVLYPSEVPAKFALETATGFIGKNKIGKGWSLELPSH